MLDRITLKHFREWQYFAQVEPFDEERDDLRFASIAATIANVNRNPKRRPSPWTLEDMRLRFGDSQRPVPSWQLMKAIGKSIAAAYGAKVD